MHRSSGAEGVVEKASPGGGDEVSKAEEAGMPSVSDHLAEGLNTQVKEPGLEGEKRAF